MSINSIYVPNEGSLGAKIMCVGESPGEEEEINKRPFIGPAGSLLERYLGRAGVQREEVFFTNLSKYRPQYNKFEYLLETKQLEQGLEELKEEIQTVKPNVIIALGNWPMWFLTGLKSVTKGSKPGTGISTWRGSTMPCSLVPEHKVYITYHPAFIVRPNGFENHPIFLNDLKRAVEESGDRKFHYPVYNEYIDPPRDTLDAFVGSFRNAEWLTVDIETFEDGTISCIGFCDNIHVAVCLTFQHKDRNWPAAQAILEGPAKKNFQYGIFDINYLRWNYGWNTNNYAFDTYVAMNNLMPGFPKKLEFMTSIYTRFPYYKEDRKTWRATYDLEKLWKYNMKDVIATHTIAIQQMEELEYERN